MGFRPRGELSILDLYFLWTDEIYLFFLYVLFIFLIFIFNFFFPFCCVCSFNIGFDLGSDLYDDDDDDDYLEIHCFGVDTCIHL